jgi:hypothetical protein
MDLNNKGEAMTTRNEDKDQAERDDAARKTSQSGKASKDTKDTAKTRAERTGVADEDLSYVGKVKLPDFEDAHSGFFDPDTGEEIPLVQTIHDVPVSDGAGGTNYAKADAPGNPDVTTSPPVTEAS